MVFDGGGARMAPTPVSDLDIEKRRTRRQARRKQLRRRRQRGLAVTALVIAGIVAGAVALAAGGSTHPGSSHTSPPPGGTTATAAHAAAGATSGASTPTAATAAHGATGAHGATASVANGPPGTTPVPLLMYHVINSPPAGAPFPGLYVDPSEFAAQMRALRDAGWHAVTLDEVQAYWRHGTPLPPGRPIVITFDNGYHSQYAEALPILRHLGWVGDLNLQLTGLPPSQGGLSDAEVRALVRDGWELDTQGFSHADLVTLDASQLRYQVADARHVVQSRYHVPVNWFCYPSGHYDATVVDAVRAAGYVGSTTTIPGWSTPAQDPYRLERIRVLRDTSPQALLDLISAVRTNGPPPPSYGTTT